MLKPLIFTPFTTNEVKPTGWLLNQLKIQANGLSGNLDKIWPDVRDSKWIGGDQEGWERVPYWLDGFVPLAYLLDDEDMKSRAKKYIYSIISRQNEDGWIAPCTEDERNTYDIWSYFLICKVLVLYADCSNDETIENVVYKALKKLDTHIEKSLIFNWAAARWYECLIPIMWLYERKPEDWMLDLVQKLQVEGVDYEKLYDNWHYPDTREKGRWSYLNHVVNAAMMLKSSALMSRFTGEDSNSFAKKAYAILQRYHGMVTGHFTGDECLSGRSPIHGAECCSVAEAMYSYEWLSSVTGDCEWTDILEMAAYNAFPATVSPDMWTHQYDQLTNQVECSKFPDDKMPFNTNGTESHLFGLEPNFGCCTANFNQAWPKLALNVLMKTENGVAVNVIAPSKLTTVINGASVSVEIITDYPFNDSYKVKVTADRKADFDLTVRIPADAVNAKIDSKPANTGYYVINRDWHGESEINVSFDFNVKLKECPNELYSVKRGNLIFALPIGERWEKREYTRNGVERKFPYCDYEIFPTTAWNYAFGGNEFETEKSCVGEQPFSPSGAPIRIKAKLIPIDWKFKDGACTEVPESRKPTGEAKILELIPYGCTNLRMTQMPIIAGE